MAKKKTSEPIIEPVEAVEAIESEVETELESEPIVEIEEQAIEAPKADEQAEAKQVSDREKFIQTQLKVINNMTNKAKAKRLAERVLRNK